MNAVIFNRAAAAAGILALALAVLVGGVSPSAAEPPTQVECAMAFEGSPAGGYCLASTVLVSGNKCDVKASCSVTVTLNFTDGTTATRTFSPSVDEANSLSDTGDIDICFSKNTSGRWVAVIKTGCQSTETNAGGAVSSGLSADPEAYE